jgi:mRNA interferase MazF
MAIYRGEIYFVSLDPVRGREMGGGKTRPVAVVSINDLNRKDLVVVVVPGTKQDGSKRSDYRNVIQVPRTPQNGLKFDTIFHCHQVRALDRNRFTTPAIGQLSTVHLQSLENAIRYSLGLP